MEFKTDISFLSGMTRYIKLTTCFFARSNGVNFVRMPSAAPPKKGAEFQTLKSIPTINLFTKSRPKNPPATDTASSLTTYTMKAHSSNEKVDPVVALVHRAIDE